MAREIAPPDAPPNEEDLAYLRRRGRRDAVIVIIGGALLLGLNHFMVLREGRISQKLVWGGTMIGMTGIFGLIEPLIMTRHLPVGKHYPVTVLLWMLLALAIGAAAGYPVLNYYRG